MLQEEPEDDIMIPLNVNSRIAPFIDRYFVRTYVDNQYKFQHSNKLFLIGISKQHPITQHSIEQITFANDKQSVQVKGKKKKGGVKVSQDQVIAKVNCDDGQEYEIKALVDGFIIEINENLIKNKQYLKLYPEDKGFIAIIQQCGRKSN